MLILQIDPLRIMAGENNKNEHVIDTPEAVLLREISKKDEVTVPPNKAISPGKLFGKILDLANEYIIYAQNMRWKTDTPTPEIRTMAMPIFDMPPWEKSNELFDALAQFTKIPASQEAIQEVKNFFNQIMFGSPPDPNGDGKQDYNDVLTIWQGQGVPQPDQKGDINNDGLINEADVNELNSVLFMGDMNFDGKLDQRDRELLKQFIEGPRIMPLEQNVRDQILPFKGDLNRDGNIDQRDLAILDHVLKAGDMNNDGKVDRTDVSILIERVKPQPTKKGDINNDGKVNREDARELDFALDAGDMNFDGKLDQRDFEILRDSINIRPIPLDQIGAPIVTQRGDLNNDGRIDQRDLDKLGHVLKVGDMDNDGKVDNRDLNILGRFPTLPPRVRIDLNNDKKADYLILGGKIYQQFDDYLKEVDHIDGVDLQELSDEILKRGAHAAPTQFQIDINHDGKLDSIFTDNMPVILPFEQTK